MKLFKGMIIAIDPFFFCEAAEIRKGKYNLAINIDILNALKSIRNLLDCKYILFSSERNQLVDQLLNVLRQDVSFVFDAVNEDLAEDVIPGTRKVFAHMYLEANFPVDKEIFLQEIVFQL